MEVVVDPSGLVDHLRTHGYVVVPIRYATATLQPLYDILQGDCTRVDTPALTGSVKTQEGIKRRLQLRRKRNTSNLSSTAAADRVSIEESFEAFEAVIEQVFVAVCEDSGICYEEVCAALFPESIGRVKSVFNAMKYVDGGVGAASAEPWCRQHCDPGILTLLARSDLAALQLQVPLQTEGCDAAEECAGPSEVEDGSRFSWFEVEKAMDEAVSTTAGDGVEAMLVLVGFTLERLTAGRYRAMVHRVPRHESAADSPLSRQTAAFELRPSTETWGEWKAAATQLELTEPEVKPEVKVNHPTPLDCQLPSPPSRNNDQAMDHTNQDAAVLHEEAPWGVE